MIFERRAGGPEAVVDVDHHHPRGAGGKGRVERDHAAGGDAVADRGRHRDDDAPAPARRPRRRARLPCRRPRSRPARRRSRRCGRGGATARRRRRRRSTGLVTPWKASVRCASVATAISEVPAQTMPTLPATAAGRPLSSTAVCERASKSSRLRMRVVQLGNLGAVEARQEQRRVPFLRQRDQRPDLRGGLAGAEHRFADTDPRLALPIGIDAEIRHWRRPAGTRCHAGRDRSRGRDVRSGRRPPRPCA